MQANLDLGLEQKPRWRSRYADWLLAGRWDVGVRVSVESGIFTSAAGLEGF
jgi:hypothetical protein